MNTEQEDMSETARLRITYVDNTSEDFTISSKRKYNETVNNIVSVTKEQREEPFFMVRLGDVADSAVVLGQIRSVKFIK